MNIQKSVLTATVGVALFGSMLAPRAFASCAVYPGAASRPSSMGMHEGRPLLLHTAVLLTGDYDDSNENGRVEPIVGLWHVKLIAQGNADIPDGTEIDAGYQAWHSDRTEILNSSRPPASGNFCLGVWEKVGDRKYKLNHFTTANDASGDPHHGTSNIHEVVTVGPKGNHFSGTFTIDAYDPNANLLYSIAGIVKGDRLTPDSLPTPLF